MAHRRFKRELTATSAELFGEELRFYRELGGYTQAELGVLLHCSRTNITRYETGQRRMPPDLVEKADELLNAGGALKRIWDRIDWNAQIGHPDWFQTHADSEAEALGLHVFQTDYMHGLLQCRDYARAMFEAGGTGERSKEIEKRVEARLARQERFLARGGPQLVVLLDESAIRSVVGGPTVMARQMQHLLRIAELENIVIQVVPFTARATIINTSMILLEMPDGQHLVYSESLDRGNPSDDPTIVSGHRRRYDRMRGDALTVGESLALFGEALKGFKDDAERARRGQVAQEQPQRNERRRLHRGGPRIPRPRPRT
ncbi:helix-turn-helix domain-containing protein [Streptomyces sp. NRRL WC-3742]|uniref:helix-turn-helix domain-containing protein n=1 Tax=Streptomyces sp. NRRL WC-3742 TaxID=1463934 RepID=UPI0004CB8268|nr:helix-turn-helix transcriptional regulator [Streptomyces sp. NRRL WC-3742]